MREILSDDLLQRAGMASTVLTLIAVRPQKLLNAVGIGFAGFVGGITLLLVGLYLMAILSRMQVDQSRPALLFDRGSYSVVADVRSLAVVRVNKDNVAMYERDEEGRYVGEEIVGTADEELYAV